MTADPASNSITFKATLFDPNAVDWKFAYVAVGYPDWDYTNAYLLGDPDGDGYTRDMPTSMRMVFRMLL